MVFINVAGSVVPFFIESIGILNNKANIKFQDQSDFEAAEGLVKKEMYLPLSQLPPLAGNKFYYHEVKGYTLKDEKYGHVGIVKEVLEYPNQAVFQVLNEGREILIPISEEVIQKVNRTKKEIHVKAPEGLIEIYL